MAHSPPVLFANPAINPPRLTSPVRRGFHLRSPSHSPVRQYAQARDLDPILRDLSPTTTLRAFRNAKDAQGGSLAQAYESSTESQRSLGAKAAQACLDIRSWTREVEGWEWPGTFDLPESVRKEQLMSDGNTGAVAANDSQMGHGDLEGSPAYWGSLPASTVQHYEQRVDHIAQELDEIDVEQLKEFVLSAHHEAGVGSASMDDSIGAIGAATDLRKLDDFTAIITATIMQALPYLSRLNHLLDIWSIRIAILRQVPAFLHALSQAQTNLDRGWTALARLHSTSTLESLSETRSVVERQVSNLGRTLDGFLDDLEGREEVVPDSWIEGFEDLEQKYAEWSVLAERRILENEIELYRAESGHKNTDSDNVRESQGNLAPIAAEGSTCRDVSRDGSHVSSLDHDLLTQMGSEDAREAVSPIGSGRVSPQHLDRELSEPRGDVPREDSSTIPTDIADQLADDGDSKSLAPSIANSQYSNSRHVPIILPYSEGDGQEYPAQGITGDLTSRALSPTSDAIISPGPQSSEAPPASIVKKRTAFLGGLERNESLQRNSKSPVRPFEHASNAFTRLFKKAEQQQSPERGTPGSSRRNSLRSTGGHRRSGSGKSEDGIIWGGRPELKPTTMSNTTSNRRGSLRDSMRPLESTPEDSPVKAAANAPPLPSLPPGHERWSTLSSARSSARNSARNSMDVPATYQPTRLQPAFEAATKSDSTANAPADKQEDLSYNENWPLVSPDPSPEARSPALQPLSLPSQDPQPEPDAESSGPEIDSPKKPMQSDALDRMFLDSLPASPDNTAISPVRAEDPLSRAGSRQKERASSHRRGMSGLSVPTVQDTMLEEPSPAKAKPRKNSIAPGFDFSQTDEPDIVLPDYDAADETQAETGPDSTSKDVDAPTFEALEMPPQNQAEAGATPGSMVSNMSSPEIEDASVGYFGSPTLSRTSTAVNGSPEHQRLDTASPLRISIPETDEIEDGAEAAAGPARISEASRTSIESHPRDSVRSINVRRRSASSLLSSNPTSPVDASTSPIDNKVALAFASPPIGSPGIESGAMPRTTVSPVNEASDTQRATSATPAKNNVTAQAMPQQRSPNVDNGDLNSFMGKRRGGPTEPARPTSKNGPKLPEGDTFDRHVSEVLEKLPSRIRFRSGAQTPLGMRTSEPRNYSGPRPKNVTRISSRQSGGLTLAPADPTPSKKANAANEPEVKLYHLTQAGREEPIKLFVRLVGENERVMVRVGGGWADLADYLRQYAEHHGSRTVSEGTIDVQTVASAGTPQSLGRRVSGPLNLEARAKIPITPATGGARPGSKDSNKSLPPADWTQPNFHAAPSSPENTSTPALDPSTSDPSSPSSPPTATFTTPSKSSRPSTAGSVDGGSSSLSGSGRKPELTEHKAKWVEGMLEKVTKASAEKSKEDKGKGFGEFGKVGGTRRVVFRSSSRLEGTGK